MVSNSDIILAMSKKHDRTLAAIFAGPVSANIKWIDIESLLKQCGAVILEGRGFQKDGDLE